MMMHSFIHTFSGFSPSPKTTVKSNTLPLSPPSTNRSKPSAHLQQRQGQRYDAFIPKDANGTIKSLLQRSLEWAEVNGTTVSKQQVENLYQNLQNTLNQSKEKATQQIAHDLGIPVSHPELPALKGMVERKIQGTPKLNTMVKWLLTFEYVPSTLFMLWTTNSIYNEMENRKKITHNERDLLFRQELARQGVGAGLHFARTLIGFEAVVWFMEALKGHRHLRQWAKPLQASSQPLEQALGKGLHLTAEKMQKLWNKMSGDTNQTIASIASLMLMNTLTYGITKPLMVNAAFYGMNEAERKEKIPPLESYAPPLRKASEKTIERIKTPALGNLADS
jgi:hypothetical protein